MDGYALGVEYYNQEKGAAVEVLGWNPATRSGLLLDFEFNNPDLGRTVTLDLFDQGADTVFAVAGGTGLGSLQAAAERKAEGDAVRVIEPDFDWFNVYGDPARVLLTSVLKNTDVAVFNTIDAFVNETWLPEPVWETLASGGVGIARFHKTNKQVPRFLKKDLKPIRAGIIDGSIPALPEVGGTACLVTDHIGGIDAGFNKSAWQGALAAAAAFPGVTVSFLESQSDADYRPNIDAFIEQGCDVIITTFGFLLADDTAAAARDNPGQDFAIVDTVVGDFAPWCTTDPLPDGTCGGDYVTNVRGSSFRTDESLLLAGYLAAGMSESGAVGTFGGFNWPSVTIFMDGFVWGVEYYNTVKGSSVAALGWDPDTQEGLFTNSFDDMQLGRDFAEDLVDQDADIVFPPAGGTSLGAPEFCQDTDTCLTIGVDTDWFFTTPEFADVVLTSVVKNVNVFVFETIENLVTSGSPGDQYVGTLANGGTDIAPYLNS